MSTLTINDKITKIPLSSRPKVKESEMIAKMPRTVDLGKSTSKSTAVGATKIVSSNDPDALTAKERAIIEAAHARFVSLPKDKKKGMSVKEMNAFFASIESDQKDAIRS